MRPLRALDCTADLIALNANYVIGLRNTPSIEAKAGIKVSTDTSDTSDCNNGVSLSVSAKDSIDFNYNGDLINLAATPDLEIFKGCYQSVSALFMGFVLTM